MLLRNGTLPDVWIPPAALGGQRELLVASNFQLASPARNSVIVRSSALVVRFAKDQIGPRQTSLVRGAHWSGARLRSSHVY
jgi:hypothetical protein